MEGPRPFYSASSAKLVPLNLLPEVRQSSLPLNQCACAYKLLELETSSRLWVQGLAALAAIACWVNLFLSSYP